MKSVCAIDVAKDKSMIFIMTETGEVLIEPHEIKHNLSDFDMLNNKIKSFNLDNLTIFMESTSTYHKPVQRYFLEHGYNVNVINPIHGKNNTRNLRLTKTDKEDCFNLADLFFKSIDFIAYVNLKSLVFISYGFFTPFLYVSNAPLTFIWLQNLQLGIKLWKLIAK